MATDEEIKGPRREFASDDEFDGFLRLVGYVDPLEREKVKQLTREMDFTIACFTRLALRVSLMEKYLRAKIEEAQRRIIDPGRLM